jgi:hypothetical protein
VLKDVLENELKRHRQKPGWVIDSSREWFEPPVRFHPKQFMDSNRYPYNFQLENNQWKNIEHKSNVLRNFDSYNFASRNPVEIEEFPKTLKEENGLAFLSAEYPCEKCGRITSDWVERFGKTKTCICRECAYKVQTPRL